MSTRRMQAFEFHHARQPLQAVERDIPVPEPRQVLLKIAACGRMAGDATRLGLCGFGAAAQLWGERSIRSVTNLTRADGEAWMKLVAAMPLRCHAQGYAFADANRALDDLRAGRTASAAVLLMDG